MNINVATGFSPLLQKVNLKRQHIEEMKLDNEMFEERNTKKESRGGYHE